jgi:hypothetical protein
MAHLKMSLRWVMQKHLFEEGDITAILLVGRSAHVPLVRQKVHAAFPDVRVRPSGAPTNAGQIAALGASVIARSAMPATPTVFISAKSEDYSLAARVHEFLESRGVPAFFSYASLPSLGSSDYRKKIDQALDQADHLIVVTSSTKNATSSWVEAEWGFFINEKRSDRKPGNLITVIAGGMRPQDLPPSLRSYEVVPLTEEGLERAWHFVR